LKSHRALPPLIVACALLGVGCTVGPDFRTPDPPAVDRYTSGPQPGAIGTVRLVPERDIPAEWWSVFGSADIDNLVRHALDASPTLDQARARLVEAQELRTARAGATQYPQVDATAGAVRQRIDPATFGFPDAPNPGPFNVFSIGADVSYTFDLFGGTRRELEGLAADVDYQGFELEAARLTLATNIVIAAIRQAALAAQIESTADILAAQRRQLAIVEQRYDLGGVAWLDVQNQRALVAQTDAVLAPLRAQWAQAGHLLAVYGGEAPAVASIPAIRLADLRLPAELPLRLPSELARQRPDIRANEALLHKASANVGVATADLYPKLVISGGFSASQLNISDLFSNGINIWNIGANLLQPLFRGGELRARERAAVAAYDQAAAAYRLSVLQGLQNVADVLRALEADEAAIAARSEQAARADDAYRITLGRFNAGGVSQLALLDAERGRLQADNERLQAQASRFANAAALFQALGGGWTSAPVAGAR
jgi:NodT family efflux transporter outer membrane factor (OMF) lipoprotein